MIQTEDSTKPDSMAVLTILAVTRGPAKEIEADPSGPSEAPPPSPPRPSLPRPLFSFARSLLFNHPFFLSRLWFRLPEQPVFDPADTKVDILLQII